MRQTSSHIPPIFIKPHPSSLIIAYTQSHVSRNRITYNTSEVGIRPNLRQKLYSLRIADSEKQFMPSLEYCESRGSLFIESMISRSRYSWRIMLLLQNSARYNTSL